jgi:thiol:disulfide interchange protein DsbD
MKFCTYLFTLLMLLSPLGSHAEDPTTLTITKPESSLFSAIGQKLGIGGNQEQFLPPEQVFILSSEVVNANTVALTWNIADGYYLYRDKFKFILKETPGIALGEAVLPKGEEKQDENFGLMEIFHHEVTVQLPLKRDNMNATDITLTVNYQGCAEAGFCYPPMKQELVLSLPEATSATAPTATTAPITDQDRYARDLAEKSLLLSMLSFFGLGLLLCFTPCVFPMVPILSSIIAGQGSNITTRRAFWLSLTYVLAMAATYTVAGILAGLFGSNLQAAFQNPWILGSFSFVFVLLSLSMFGFYDLQMPHGIQSRLTEMSNKQQGGTFVGVAIMGLLSALIVGPCMAAPLAGALIYIGQSGDAVLGGAALFALSLGMGAPLLAIGTSAGKLLPRAGDWMNTVKAVFGVMLLAVAIWMVERIIPAPVTLALWGILLVVCAIYLGALEHLQPEATGWHKLWKGMGVIMLIYGSMLLVGALSGGNDPLRPLGSLNASSAVAAESQKLAFKQIKGVDGLQRELQLASTQGKAVMLDFYADWCVSCKEMEKLTFSNPTVQNTLRDVVLLQADVTANDEADQALLKKFGLFGPPSILFFSPSGEELSQYRLVGFLEPERFNTLAATALQQ